ncbi:hypothetical protein HD554DRAFT_2030686 [Boletus coccyginus]|nr:hypothetical protein HD554DRAFT_2030686 [Boletus coccyginus]
MGSGQLLQGVEILEEIFGDVPFSRNPRIVVELLDKRIPKLPPSVHRPIMNVDPIIAARAAFLSFATKDKPSSTGAPSSFRKRQLDSRRCKSIPCGRPKEYEDTIPVTLLHTIFRDFIYDCQNIEVTLEDESFAQSLAIAMSALYQNESERVGAVGKEFQGYGIHLTVPEAKAIGYVMDAYMSFKEHHYVIAEFKNETGNTSAEPHFQAIGYYLEATRNSALKFGRSPLPCLLLTIHGSRMEFTGATWNLRPTTQLLSTPIAFHYHSTDTNNHLTVSRHMAAFRKAIKSLKVYYENLEDDENLNTTPGPSATAIPPPTTIFPDRRNYKSSLTGTQVPFRYLRQLQEDKLVFSGIEDQGRNICVKFVQAYSLGAHLHLATLGRAPAIRGYEMIAGGWTMVVMDMLSPREFRTLTKAREELLPLDLFNDILEALKSLHGAGFVHGDIRDTNIMVSIDNRDFKIIDFDWAGTIGQARYPMNVNRGPELWRPDDAVDRAPITAQHDRAMLDYIVMHYKNRHHGTLSL